MTLTLKQDQRTNHWLVSVCYAKSTDSSCSYGTSSLGEFLLTATPKQLVKDTIFWFWSYLSSVTFFLELNHGTLTGLEIKNATS